MPECVNLDREGSRGTCCPGAVKGCGEDKNGIVGRQPQAASGCTVCRENSVEGRRIIGAVSMLFTVRTTASRLSSKIKAMLQMRQVAKGSANVGTQGQDR